MSDKTELNRKAEAFHALHVAGRSTSPDFPTRRDKLRLTIGV